MASSPTQPAGCRETNNPGALMTCFPAQFGPHTYKDIEIEKLTHLAGAPEVALGPALSRAGTAPPGRQPLGPSRRPRRPAPQSKQQTRDKRVTKAGAGPLQTAQRPVLTPGWRADCPVSARLPGRSAFRNVQIQQEKQKNMQYRIARGDKVSPHNAQQTHLAFRARPLHKRAQPALTAALVMDSVSVCV